MAVFQLVLNKGQWNKLSDADKQAFEIWFPAMLTALGRASNLEDRRVAAADRESGKVTIIDWPQSERDKFRSVAMQAWKDVAAKSPLAKEALDLHVSFMKKIGLLE
jgi:TRAP-type C4-dicarboxylate transport system substrate-binding protein